MKESGAKPLFSEETIGHRLRIIMVQAGMTVNELARIARVNPTGLSHWLHDRRKPERSNVIRLASALGCDPADIDSDDGAYEAPVMRETVGLPALIEAIITDHLSEIMAVAAKMGIEITVTRRIT